MIVYIIYIPVCRAYENLENVSTVRTRCISYAFLEAKLHNSIRRKKRIGKWSDEICPKVTNVSPRKTPT